MNINLSIAPSNIHGPILFPDNDHVPSQAALVQDVMPAVGFGTEDDSLWLEEFSPRRPSCKKSGMAGWSTSTRRGPPTKLPVLIVTMAVKEICRWCCVRVRSLPRAFREGFESSSRCYEECIEKGNTNYHKGGYVAIAVQCL